MNISTPQKDCQLLQMVRMHRFISAPRLRMQKIRRFERRMSVRTIQRWFLAIGYWSRHPARCSRLTLEHRWCRREWGRRHRVWDLGQWRHCGGGGVIHFSDPDWHLTLNMLNWVHVWTRSWPVHDLPPMLDCTPYHDWRATISIIRLDAGINQHLPLPTAHPHPTVTVV